MSILRRFLLAASLALICGCETQPHHETIDPSLLALIEEALQQSMNQAGLSPEGPQIHKLTIQTQILAANAADDQANIQSYLDGKISQEQWLAVLQAARQLYLDRINIGRAADAPDRDGLPLMLHNIFENPDSSQNQWVLARCWLRQLLIKEGLKAPSGWNLIEPSNSGKQP